VRNATCHREISNDPERVEGFNRVHNILRNAAGVQFTGAVARIEHQGRVLFEQAYGETRAGELAQPVYADTRFDLASITKLFVSTLALHAVEEGRIDLDERLTPWFDEWRGSDHEPITLRMLLAHTSGMNSGADYRQLLGHNVVRYALERELIAAPGTRVVYSDLGFIAIGELLERIYGKSLAALMLLLRGSPVYRPAETVWRTIPATEDDGWRGRVQGYVHDEKAYLIGGVAGHAGLFGTAEDVAWLAEYYLSHLCGRARDGALGVDVVREATSEQAYDPVLRRGLGWALKTSDENSCGRYFSMHSFGHTGFVGTCVWADPQRDCSGVLLTNSVYFGRNDTRDLRASFYEALIEDLGL
jgi:CubicO group peptidase (beta-lactamase class C family)